MTNRWCFGLVTVLAVSISVGCSMSNPKVRAQSPDNAGPIIGSAPGYGDLKRAPYLGNHGPDYKAFGGFQNENFGYNGGFYSGPQGYYTDRQQPYTVNGAGGRSVSRWGFLPTWCGWATWGSLSSWRCGLPGMQ